MAQFCDCFVYLFQFFPILWAAGKAGIVVAQLLVRALTDPKRNLLGCCFICNHVGNSLLSNIGLTFYWNACNQNVALAAKKMMRYAAGMEKTSHTDLKNWIKDNGLTQRKFAAMLSERDEQISRWINGKVRPEKYARMYIELETLGAVRADGWP